MKNVPPNQTLSPSPGATARIAARIAKHLVPGSVLALRGPLGSGKTTFVKGLAHALGIRGKIVSPSFVIVAPYPVRRGKIKNLYHFDLYRLRSARELRVLGFSEIIKNSDGVTVIEWPEIAKPLLPNKTRYLDFQMGKSPKERRIKIW